jgi:hypothetical protein
MKKKLILLGMIVFTILVITNLSSIKGVESKYGLRLKNIQAFSDTKKTFKSCLINQNPVVGRKKPKSDIPNRYCYKKQDKGVDIFCGETVECISDSKYKGIPCVPAICNAKDSTCFASKRKPVTANFLE